MYDNSNDIFDFLNSNSNTMTETENNQSQTNYDMSSNQYHAQPYSDDYSVNGNYQGQQTYNSQNYYTTVETQPQTTNQVYEIPVIDHDSPSYSLTKTKQKIYLSTRLKIIAVCFAIIMSSLMVATAWNFIYANNLQTTISANQVEINAIQNRISSLKEEYNLVSDDETLHSQALQDGYVDSNESNTFYLTDNSSSGETITYVLPSNWFNDVCEFFSRLFA